MNKTSIEWTDYSANLLKYRDDSGKTVWACAKVSDGCKNCYAETLAHRYARGGPYTLQQTRKVTPFFDIHEGNAMLRAKKISGKRVFIDDMTDLFGEWVPDGIIDQHFALFAQRQDVTFQVLTKRPERMAAYLDRGAQQRIADDLMIEQMVTRKTVPGWNLPWPLPNVWLGTSCENRATLDRVMDLSACPAAVHFWSLEPLLEDLGNIRGYLEQNVEWAIVGCESRGNYAGRFAEGYTDAARSILNQCAEADVPVFHKQTVIGKRVSGEPLEWDEDLRVREMPEVTA